MTFPALKPCPFCGGAAHFQIDADRWEWVECASCGMQGNRSASLMEDCKPILTESWNRRSDESIRSALENILKAYRDYRCSIADVYREIKAAERALAEGRT